MHSGLGLTHQSSIINQENAPLQLSTDEGIFSVEEPLSQMTEAYGKLTNKNLTDKSGKQD